MLPDLTIEVNFVDDFNPFYPEASADELQPVPDHFHQTNISALKNDRLHLKWTELYYFSIKCLM